MHPFRSELGGERARGKRGAEGHWRPKHPGVVWCVALGHDLVVSSRLLPNSMLERLGLPDVVVRRHHPPLPLSLPAHAHSVALNRLALDCPAIVETCSRTERMRSAGQGNDSKAGKALLSGCPSSSPKHSPLETPPQISPPNQYTFKNRPHKGACDHEWRTLYLQAQPLAPPSMQTWARRPCKGCDRGGKRGKKNLTRVADC